MIDKQTPLMAVVIPCHNVEQHVRGAIEGALANREFSLQVIAVDDGSTDDTLKVLRDYDDRITILTGPNNGACAARNKGLVATTAPFVVFMDGDDAMHSGMLRDAAAALEAANADLAFGPSTWVYPDRTVRYEAPDVGSPQAALRFLFTCRFVQTGSIVWRTEFCRRIGGWREGVARRQDHEFLVRALSYAPRITNWRGAGNVYHQIERPGRITGTWKDSTFESIVEVVGIMRGRLLASGILEEEADRLLQPYCYNIWRAAATAGSRRAEAAARTLYERVGGFGHRGSYSHRMLASLLGLRTKQRLSRILSRPARMDDA